MNDTLSGHSQRLRLVLVTCAGNIITEPGRTAAWRCSTVISQKTACIVKTAGVDDSILKFTGPAKVYESQDDAVEAILGKVVAGDVVVDPL